MFLIWFFPLICQALKSKKIHFRKSGKVMEFWPCIQLVTLIYKVDEHTGMFPISAHALMSAWKQRCHFCINVEKLPYLSQKLTDFQSETTVGNGTNFFAASATSPLNFHYPSNSLIITWRVGKRDVCVHQIFWSPPTWIAQKLLSPPPFVNTRKFGFPSRSKLVRIGIYQCLYSYFKDTSYTWC